MTYQGHIENGHVVLDEPAELPEGASVTVSIEFRQISEQTGQTLAERYSDFIGAIDSLPPDAAENHDHYLYGVPKRRNVSL